MRSDGDLLEIDRPDGEGVLRLIYGPFIPPSPGFYSAIVYEGKLDLDDDIDPDDARLNHPGVVTSAGLLHAIESGALPLDSDPARRVIALQDGTPASTPDYSRRVAEAVRAYAEWLAERTGGQVDAEDPRRWSDAAIRIPHGVA